MTEPKDEDVPEKELSPEFRARLEATVAKALAERRQMNDRPGVEWVDRALVLASQLPDDLKVWDAGFHWDTISELIQTIKGAFDPQLGRGDE